MRKVLYLILGVLVLFGLAGPMTIPALADDTGWVNPTANAADTGGDGNGFEGNPGNAYTDGSGYASNTNGAGDRHRYYNYNLNIPAGATITGIEVRLDWWLDNTSGTNSMSVELSWNGGTSWTTAKIDSTESTTEHSFVLGGSADTWGHPWTVNELSNANFRVMLTCNSTSGSRDFYIDWVPARVYYSTALAVSISGNTSFCPGTSTTLTANASGGTPPYSYNWSASTTPGTANGNTYIATGPGTVVVTVTDSATCSSTVVSDTNTMVTRGNVPGVTYPHNAVLAWVHPNWWPSLTGYNFNYPNNTAQWIWESYQAVHPVEGDVVYFERSFTIPSPPIGATIRITCDNGYEVYINGNYLGWAQLADYGGIPWEDSNLTDNWVFPSGWNTIETYTVPSTSLIQGANVLEIRAANEQVNGGTVDSNPAGLIYELVYEFNCTATASVAVTLNPVPATNFTAAPLSGPAPLSVQFTDTSTGSPTSWSWDFNNDGTPDSSAQNPSYQYNSQGIYTVKLTVINTYGCSDDEIKTDYITVDQPPAAPTVNSIEIYSNPGCTQVADSMTPQTTYYTKVSITSNNNLSYLDTVRVTIFYDSSGANPPAPVIGNTQTCAILTCTVGPPPSWAIDPSNPPTDTTWQIVPGSCSQPANLNVTTGDWIFAFVPGKVATESVTPANWDAQGKATNKSSQTGELYIRNKTMNWYGEISVNTNIVDWGTVPLGLTFGNATYNPKTVSIKYVANGDYFEDVKSSASWTGSTDTVTLDMTGGNPPPASMFALMADNTAVLNDALVVTTQYKHINASGGLTGEAGVTAATNSLWLSLGEMDIAPVIYSGAIYYQVANR